MDTKNLGVRSVLTILVLICVNCCHSASCEQTKASVYANSLAGRKTASGKPYKPGAMTAAS